MSNHMHEGFIPAYVLQDLDVLNPTLRPFTDTLSQNKLLLQAATRQKGWIHQLTAGGNGDRRIYDAQHRRSLPGVRARWEGDSATSDATVDLAYEIYGDVRDFVLNVAGRNSIDNQGMNLIVTVHYGRNYNNAFWNGRQMTHGDGDGKIFRTFVLLDVGGHEIWHGITEYESGLVYRNQPGALNEHMSDVAGALVRQYKLKLKADQDSWLVGPGLWADGVNGRALRDMLNPGTAYDDPKVGKDRQPGHMDDLYTGWGDNGGVHINSGIPNRAFANFALAVGGYAWEAPFEIWDATNHGKNKVGSNAKFQQWADRTLANCADLYPQHEKKLKDAWKLVGITAK